jgi:hypothetical protein
MPVSLMEIKKMKSFNKLSAYTHLFKNIALNSFLSLTEDGDDSYLDERRATAEEIGDDHVDNDRAVIDVEGFESSDNYSVGDLKSRMVALIDKIRASMEEDK